MSSNPPPIEPTPLTALDRFWLDTTRGAVKQSIESLESAAKQLIAITTLASTIYFAAVSFSGIKAGLIQFDSVALWGFAIIFSVPIALWLASLWFSILVFKPEIYLTNLDSPDLARETYESIAAYKHKQLQRAYLFLAVGFAPLLVNILAYLIFIPPTK
ncbi:MAG TPA: hypothetical protein VFD70_04755 [Anaerolineae bacterium]|nr:hypothetical protein [Anaerolineae bacterium]